MDKKILRVAAFLLFVPYALYGFLLFPLDEIFSTNVVLAATVWSDIIYQLRVFAEPLLLSLIFGALIFGVYRYGAARLRPLYLLSGGALLLGYVARLLSHSVLFGSLDLTLNYVSALVSLLTECGVAALVVFFAHRNISYRITLNKEKARSAALLGETFDENEGLFPLQQLFSRQNELQKSALFGAGVLGAVRLVNFLVAALSSGAYELSDFPFFILNLTLDILLPFVLCYFVTVGVCRWLCRKYK